MNASLKKLQFVSKQNPVVKRVVRGHAVVSGCLALFSTTASSPLHQQQQYQHNHPQAPEAMEAAEGAESLLSTLGFGCRVGFSKPSPDHLGAVFRAPLPVLSPATDDAAGGSSVPSFVTSNANTIRTVTIAPSGESSSSSSSGTEPRDHVVHDIRATGSLMRAVTAPSIVPPASPAPAHIVSPLEAATIFTGLGSTLMASTIRACLLRSHECR